LIEDHINLFPDHPLRGINDENYGPRFPDMSSAYSVSLRKLIHKSAYEQQIPLQHGVYFGWPGPSLETPAEYRMIHRMGGDVVGMSSIPEVLVARYYNMNVCMISVVSNVCFPREKIKETTVQEVIEVMNHSATTVGNLLLSVLK
jgi:purine-nucleoside phosphorylase